jgi:hypothetical protein
MSVGFLLNLIMCLKGNLVSNEEQKRHLYLKQVAL